MQLLYYKDFCQVWQEKIYCGLAKYFGSIVEAVTSQVGNNTSAIDTEIGCRRRPGARDVQEKSLPLTISRMR